MAFTHLQGVAFDLDGTLLNASSMLSPRTQKLLTQLDEKHIPVIIASGRPFSTIPKEILAHPAVRYIVTGNGVSVYDKKLGQRVHYCGLRPEAVDAIVELTKYYPVAHEIFIDGHAYAPAVYLTEPEKYGVMGKAQDYIRNTRQIFDDIHEFVTTHRQHIDCMGLSMQDLALKEQLWKRLEKEIEHIYVTSSLPRLIEVADHQAGKGNAVAYVLEALHIPAEGLIAFGDAHNDSGMLSLAGLGVAMDNAEADLKAIADVITDHHDQDGVAKLVEQYL